MRRAFPLLLSLCFPLAQAELRPLAETELEAVNGQDGISVSAAIRLNANPHETRCPGGCGARVAIRPGHSDGVIAIDNIKGTFSFDGLTLDVVTIDSGFNGEGALFNKDAIKIGLRESRLDNVQYSLSGASSADTTQPGFHQHDLLTYHANGQILLRGNVYIFPSD